MSGAAALDARLADAPERIWQHSKALRGALPLIDPPLRLWLSGLKDRTTVEEAAAAGATGREASAGGEASADVLDLARPEHGAAALLWLLVDVCGDACSN